MNCIIQNACYQVVVKVFVKVSNGFARTFDKVSKGFVRTFVKVSIKVFRKECLMVHNCLERMLNSLA